MFGISYHCATSSIVRYLDMFKHLTLILSKIHHFGANDFTNKILQNSKKNQCRSMLWTLWLKLLVILVAVQSLQVTKSGISLLFSQSKRIDIHVKYE